MSTPRAHIEAALSQDGTNEIPAVICYEGIYVRDHWKTLTAAPWWHQFSSGIAQQVAWRSDVLGRTGHDWFEIPGAFYTRQERAAWSIDVRPDGVYRINGRTGIERRLVEPQIGGWDTGPAGTQSIHPDHLADTYDEIDALIPEVSEFDALEASASGVDDLARELSRQQPGLFPLGYVAAPLWRTYHLWGFSGMMEMVALRPDLVRHACERYLAEGLRTIQEAAWLGAAGIWIEDCLTDVISPPDFTTLNVPYLRRLVDEVRAAGMKSIHYYCGNPNGKWDALLSTGADALALEESKKGFAVDIEEVAERVRGRCALLGNLDAIGILQDGDEGRLRAEIKRQMTAGRRNGSRFIMSIGSPVTPGTPVERVRLYCELVHEMGRKRDR